MTLLHEPEDLGERLQAWTCPVSLADHATIVMGHGGGGKLSADLVEHLFVPAFRPPDGEGPAVLARLGDSAVVPAPPGRLAMTTDSYVVRPLFFPGGSIGELAVNGTVNDLAMVGATPLYLTVGLILEEGLPIETLARVVEAMGAAAREAGVTLVAGDTKVVDAGHGDGVYVNTAGVGVVADGVDVGPDRARPGDVIVVSGPIGRHGVAILSVREGLEFGTTIASDTAPLHGLVAAMLEAAPRAVRALRDPTRGGLAATLTELAESSRVGVMLEDSAIPVPSDVDAACRFLGLDPMHVANEGVLVAFVAPDRVEAVLSAMRSHGRGRDAVVVGRAVADHPGLVVTRTGIGGTRIVDRQIGEQLPRIC